MPDDEKFSIHIDGKEYELDDLTLGEIEELEDAFDRPMEQIDLNRAKAITMLVWFVRRREDSKFTLEMARKINISRLGAAEATGNGHPPTKPAKARRTAGPQSSGSTPA